MLIKRTDRRDHRTTRADCSRPQAAPGMDRRTFLRRAGLTSGSLAALGGLSLSNVRKVEAGPPARLGAEVAIRKSVCTFCSVGCTISAEVANGVWLGQEPAWDSPLNRGSHCAKGAAARETVIGERRLRYPMKLLNGYWVRLSWETAIDEIGERIAAIRTRSGPDAVYWLGSAKMSNETAYLYRKLAAFWGTALVRWYINISGLGRMH